MEELKEGEELKSWNDFNGEQQYIIAKYQAKAIKSRSYLTMLRIFNLANPKIIIGPGVCRIAPESVEIMTLLTKTYLKK